VRKGANERAQPQPQEYILRQAEREKVGGGGELNFKPVSLYPKS
jgi:hypothetical protein